MNVFIGMAILFTTIIYGLGFLLGSFTMEVREILIGSTALWITVMSLMVGVYLITGGI